MSPRLRKLELAAHVTFSVGWLGSVLAFLALAIACVTSHDAQIVRASCLAMALIVSYVIVPLAFGSLLTGLISSLATKWGLFRHYWVVVKLVLTMIAIVVLLQQGDPIRSLASAAANPSASIADLGETGRPLVHAIGGLVVLFIVQVLGLYKPRGMTRYGWRKQHAEQEPVGP